MSTSEPSIGQVHITGVDIDPLEVEPGGTVRVTVNVTETAEVVGPLGQLRLCNPDTNFNATGLQVKTVVNPEWFREINETVCIPVYFIGSGQLKLNFDLTAPDTTGNYSVDTRIVSTKDNTRSDRIRQTVTVSEGDGAEDSPTGGQDGSTTNPIDGGNGGGGNNNNNNNNGNGKDWFDFIVNNPGKSTVIGVGAAFVVDQTLNSVLGE